MWHALLALIVTFSLQSIVSAAIVSEHGLAGAVGAAGAVTIPFVVPRPDLRNGFVSTGISLNPDGSILAVRNGSIAEKSGIRAGDYLVAIGQTVVSGSASRAARALLAEQASSRSQTDFVLLRMPMAEHDVPSEVGAPQPVTIVLFLLVDALLGASGALGLVAGYRTRLSVGKSIALKSPIYKGLAAASLILWVVALLLRLQPLLHSSSDFDLMPAGKGGGGLKHALLVALSALSVVVPSLCMSLCALRGVERHTKGAVEVLMHEERSAKRSEVTATARSQCLEAELADFKARLQSATVFAFEQATKCMEAEARLVVHMDLLLQPQPTAQNGHAPAGKKVTKQALVRRRCAVQIGTALDIIDEEPREAVLPTWKMSSE